MSGSNFPIKGTIDLDITRAIASLNTFDSMLDKVNQKMASIKGVTASTGQNITGLGNTFSSTSGNVTQFGDAVTNVSAKANQGLQSIVTTAKGVGAPFQQAGTSVQQFSNTYDNTGRVIKSTSTAVDQNAQAVNRLSPTYRQLDSNVGLVSNSQNKYIDITRNAIAQNNQYTGALGNMGRSLTSASGSAEQLVKSKQNLFDKASPLISKFSGLSFSVTGLVTAYNEAINMSGLLEDAQKRVDDATTRLNIAIETHGKLSTEATRAQLELEKAERALGFQNRVVNLSYQDMLPFVVLLGSSFTKIATENLPKLIAKKAEWAAQGTSLFEILKNKLNPATVKMGTDAAASAANMSAVAPAMITSAKGTDVATASMGRAAIAANTLKFSIRSLLVATGIGAAIVAASVAFDVWQKANADSSSATDKLTTSTENFGKVIPDVDTKTSGFNSTIADLKAKATEAKAPIDTLAESIGNVVSKLFAGGFIPEVKETGEPLTEAEKEEGIKPIPQSQFDTESQTSGRILEFSQLAKEVQEDITKRAEEATEQIREMTLEINTLNKSEFIHAQALAHSGENYNKLVQVMGKYNPELQANTQEYVKNLATQHDIERQLKAQNKELINSAQNMGLNSAELELLNSEHENFVNVTSDTNKNVDVANNKLALMILRYGAFKNALFDSTKTIQSLNLGVKDGVESFNGLIDSTLRSTVAQVTFEGKVRDTISLLGADLPQGIEKTTSNYVLLLEAILGNREAFNTLRDEMAKTIQETAKLNQSFADAVAGMVNEKGKFDKEFKDFLKDVLPKDLRKEFKVHAEFRAEEAELKKSINDFLTIVLDLMSSNDNPLTPELEANPDFTNSDFTESVQGLYDKIQEEIEDEKLSPVLGEGIMLRLTEAINQAEAGDMVGARETLQKALGLMTGQLDTKEVSDVAGQKVSEAIDNIDPKLKQMFIDAGIDDEQIPKLLALLKRGVADEEVPINAIASSTSPQTIKNDIEGTIGDIEMKGTVTNTPEMKSTIQTDIADSPIEMKGTITEAPLGENVGTDINTELEGEINPVIQNGTLGENFAGNVQSQVEGTINEENAPKLPLAPFVNPDPVLQQALAIGKAVTFQMEEGAKDPFPNAPLMNAEPALQQALTVGQAVTTQIETGMNDPLPIVPAPNTETFLEAVGQMLETTYNNFNGTFETLIEDINEKLTEGQEGWFEIMVGFIDDTITEINRILLNTEELIETMSEKLDEGQQDWFDIIVGFIDDTITETDRILTHTEDIIDDIEQAYKTGTVKWIKLIINFVDAYEDEIDKMSDITADEVKEINSELDKIKKSVKTVHTIETRRTNANQFGSEFTTDAFSPQLLIVGEGSRKEKVKISPVGTPEFQTDNPEVEDLNRSKNRVRTASSSRSGGSSNGFATGNGQTIILNENVTVVTPMGEEIGNTQFRRMYKNLGAHG